MKNKHEILADLLSDESFVRWIRGEASLDEQQRWNKWLSEKSDRNNLVREAQRLYNLPFHELKESDTSSQLHRLQQSIDRHENSRTAAKTFELHRPPRRKWSVYAAVASVVLLIGITFALFRYAGNTTQPAADYAVLQTAYGQKDSLKLADGSSIILNAHSTLRYDRKSLLSDNVRFELKGEAYFKIIHNPERKLVVQTGDGLIEDIGTQFNVNTRGNFTSVALVEGEVKIFKKARQGGETSSYEARPGEFIQFSDTGTSITAKRSNLNFYTSWTQDKLVLDDTPFRDIVAKLEQTYGVDIEVGDQDLLDRKVSGSIRSPNLEIVLKGLAQTMRLDIKRNGNKILISSNERE